MESVNYLLRLISKYKIATLDARASTSVNHISTSGLAILVAEQSYQAICIHWIIVIYFCTHNCTNNVRIQRGHEIIHVYWWLEGSYLSALSCRTVWRAWGNIVEWGLLHGVQDVAICCSTQDQKAWDNASGVAPYYTLSRKKEKRNREEEKS